MSKFLVSVASVCVIIATGYYGYSEYVRTQEAKNTERRTSIDQIIRYAKYCTDVLQDPDFSTASGKLEYDECLSFAQGIKSGR